MQQASYLINGECAQGVSPLDRGFAYGDGIFRTLKVVKGAPVQWSLHYQKLVNDCNVLGIACPDSDLLMQDVEKLFSTSKVTEAVLKVIITRGTGGRGYAVPETVAPSRILIQTDMPTYDESYYQTGVDLFLCETRLAHQPQLSKIKHLNRLENVVARAEVSESFFDGLLRDLDGHVVECTSANLFIRNGRTLYTSALNQCGVAGVTRQRIMDIAPKLGFTIQEADFTLAQLFGADEVMISNSVYGAFQVKTVGEKKWVQQPLAEQIRIELDAS